MNLLLQRLAKIFHQEGFAGVSKSIASFMKYRWYSIRYQTYYWRLRHRYGDSTPEPYRLINVNPKSVKNLRYSDITQIRSQCKFLPYGTYILDGDWDKTEFFDHRVTNPRFELMVESLQNRFQHSIPWEETKLYEYLTTTDNELAEEYREGNVKTKLEKIDKIYNSIADEGFRTQSELRTDSSNRNDHSIQSRSSIPEINEIGVGITRKGEFVWLWDGNHRLLISKILDLDTIPVRVVARHKIWQNYRTKISQANNENDLHDDVRGVISHPDMLDVSDHIK